MKRLSRPARRALLVVHVTVSVGWLGVSLCMLALGISGAAAAGAPHGSAEGAYHSMKIFTDWLLPPIALLSLFSGLVLSLGTQWGLARHRWVYVKFWLTLAAVLLTAFSLRPTVGDAAARVAAGGSVDGADLIVPPAVSLSLYAFVTAVSVLKPWGLTRKGRRLREERVPAARNSVAARPARRSA